MITQRIPVSFTDPAGLPLIPYVPTTAAASHRYVPAGLNDTNTTWVNSIGPRPLNRVTGSGPLTVKTVAGLRYMEIGRGTPVTRYAANGADMGTVAAIGAVVRFRPPTTDAAVFTTAPVNGASVKRRPSRKIALANAAATNNLEHTTVIPDELWATVLASVDTSGTIHVSVNGITRLFPGDATPGVNSLEVGYAAGLSTDADFLDVTVWPTHTTRGKDYDQEMRALYPALSWS